MSYKYAIIGSKGGVQMKNLFIEIINNCFESKVMKSYLIENIEEIRKCDIIDFVLGAQIELSKKYDYIKAVYDIFQDDKEEFSSAGKLLKELDMANAELNVSDNEFLLLNENVFNNQIYDDYFLNRDPFSSFDEAIEYVKSLMIDYEDKNIDDITKWYEIEKFRKDENGKWNRIITWIVTLDGRVIYVHGDNLPEIGYFIDSLYIPLPFKVGDILKIDCRPFLPPKFGVITGMGDNRDCCCAQFSWITPDGKIQTGALKHNQIFDDFYYCYMQGLFRAEIYKGESNAEVDRLYPILELIEADERETEKNICRYNEKFYD